MGAVKQGDLNAPEKHSLEHHLAAFHSGESALDDWLRRRTAHHEAGCDCRPRLSSVFPPSSFQQAFKLNVGVTSIHSSKVSILRSWIFRIT